MPAPEDEQRLLAALWSATDLYRVLVLGYVAYLYAARLDEVARPALGWAVLAVLGAWTVLVAVLRRRSTPFLVAELAIATVAVLMSRVVDTPEAIAAGAPTVPGMWPAATVVAWALARGPAGGLLAAGAVAAADLIVIEIPSEVTVHNIVILLLLGGCLGYCSDLARSGYAALRAALAAQARTAERERLARTVHDGVLQTLAYIHRRGLEGEGEVAELGQLAGAQERVLRSLVADPSGLSPPDAGGARGARGGWPRVGGHGRRGDGAAHDGADSGDAGVVDVAGLLRAHAGEGVTVAAPASEVLLPERAARELDAAVRAALDNVGRHAGPGARAWILLEVDGGEVVVTIRDNGPGIPPGRLARAREEGRLGVASSIVGRLSDLGGHARVDEGSGTGARLELRLPGTLGRPPKRPR